MRIKDWNTFQHFKDRRPPWIKLYRYLLDDPEWHELRGEDAKALIALWLIASDDATGTGTLPCLRNLAFRLRQSEKQTIETISRLSHWLVQDDITVISNGYQVDAPEKRRDREETEAEVLFEKFWEEYPKRKDKTKAQKAFLKIKPDSSLLEKIINSLKAQKESKDWQKENGQFIPYPTTWLNGRRWEDEPETGVSEWQ